MILKVLNPKTKSWVYFDGVQTASVAKWGAYTFVLDDPAEGGDRHLRLSREFGPLGDSRHSPDFMFLDEGELIESLKALEHTTPASKATRSTPAKVARLVMKEGPPVEVAWLAAPAFLLNDEGKTIERL